MKKNIKVVTLFVMLLMLSVVGVFALGGCASRKSMASKEYEQYTDLAADATYSVDGKERSSFRLKGKEAERAVCKVDLGKEQTFNTIVLNESSKSVLKFNIWASNSEEDESYELIYKGDTIEDFRVCFTGELTYRYLRVDVVSSTGSYNVNDIKIYNNINESSEKRVVSYFVLDNLLWGDSQDQYKALDTITDLILFGMTDFDVDGNIILTDSFREKLADENTKQSFIKNVENLNTAIDNIEQEQGRHINVLLDVFMPERHNPDDPNAGARNMMSNETAVNNAIDNINKAIEVGNLDGVDFDYEYPYTGKEWRLYNDFLVSVKNGLPKGKILSTAIGGWNVDFDKEAIEAVDFMQLMTYDMFDSHGYHGAFNSSLLLDLVRCVNKGLPVEKIVLGLPFYSRPVNRGGYWGDYKKFVEEGLVKDKYTNIVYDWSADDWGNMPIDEPEYFNGYQMICDKTAYAIDSHCAGVMIWHYHCDVDYDNELSLFRAINNIMQAKQAKLVTNM